MLVEQASSLHAERVPDETHIADRLGRLRLPNVARSFAR